MIAGSRTVSETVWLCLQQDTTPNNGRTAEQATKRQIITFSERLLSWQYL